MFLTLPLNFLSQIPHFKKLSTVIEFHWQVFAKNSQEFHVSDVKPAERYFTYSFIRDRDIGRYNMKSEFFFKISFLAITLLLEFHFFQNEN